MLGGWVRSSQKIGFFRLDQIDQIIATTIISQVSMVLAETHLRLQTDQRNSRHTCCAEEEGGLGILNIKIMNIALLDKW